MTDVMRNSSSVVQRSGALKRRKSQPSTPDGFVLLTEDEPLEEKKENNNLTEYRERPSSPSASDATNDLSPFDHLGSPDSPPPFNPMDNERLPNELLDEICSDVGFKDTMDVDIVEFLMDQEVSTSDSGQPADLFCVGGLFSKFVPGDRPPSPGQVLQPPGYSACSSTSGSPVSKRFHAAPLSSQSSPQKECSSNFVSSSKPSIKPPKTPVKSCPPVSDGNSAGFQSPSRNVQAPCGDGGVKHTPSKAGQVGQPGQCLSSSQSQQPNMQHHQQQQMPGATDTPACRSMQQQHAQCMSQNSSSRCCSPSTGAPPPLHHLGPRPGHTLHHGPPGSQMNHPQVQRMPQTGGYRQPQSPSRSGFQKFARPSPPVVNVLNMPDSQGIPQTSQNSHWMGNSNNNNSHQQHGPGMPNQQYQEMNQTKFDQGKLGFYNNPNAASQYMNQQGRTLDSPLDQGYFSGDTASVRSFSSSSSSTGTTVLCGGMPPGKGHMMRGNMGSNPAMGRYMAEQNQHPQEINVYRAAAQGDMNPNGGYPPEQQQYGPNYNFSKPQQGNEQQQSYPGQMCPPQQQGNPPVNQPYPSPGMGHSDNFDNSFNPQGTNFERDFNDNEQKSISTKILPRCSPYIKSDLAPYTVPCNPGQAPGNTYDFPNPNMPNSGLPPQQAGGHNMEIAPNSQNYDNCRQTSGMQNSNMPMMSSMGESNMNIQQGLQSPGRGYNMNPQCSSTQMNSSMQAQGSACDPQMQYNSRPMQQQGNAMNSYAGQMPATPPTNSCGGMPMPQSNITSTPHQPHPGQHSNMSSGPNAQYPMSNNPMCSGGGPGQGSWQSSQMPQQGNPMGNPQQMGTNYGKPQGVSNVGMLQGQTPGGVPGAHICDPNCNCKSVPQRRPISSQQSFIQSLITDRSNAFRSHPLFPLLRDLIIADMNFNSPSFPYQLIRNLPADFDKLLQNFLQRNPPNGSYQNNYAVESVIMDALKYAHQCLIEKIKVRQEQDKHTKTTSKSLSAIEEFCEKFDRAVRNSMSKPEHPAPGNHSDMGGPDPGMMNGGRHTGVVHLQSNNTGMPRPEEMPPPTGYLPSPMKKMDHMGGLVSHFQVLRDLPDSASESGSSISSTCHNKTESKKHPSLPKEAVAMMLDWLRNHKDNPYPNDDEKAMLIKQTGLTINQINYWFTNARRRILPKWAQAKT